MSDTMADVARRAGTLAATLVALVLCWPGSAGAAGPHDPTLLSCTFTGGRTIGGIVLFKTLKKLRIWYGDGGGEEWTHVDFRNDPITTGSHDDTNIVLSGDTRRVTLNMDDEHSTGECRTASTAGVPKYWLAPVLRQH
jgi:hypothetical protein